MNFLHTHTHRRRRARRVAVVMLAGSVLVGALLVLRIQGVQQQYRDVVSSDVSASEGAIARAIEQRQWEKARSLLDTNNTRHASSKDTLRAQIAELANTDDQIQRIERLTTSLLMQWITNAQSLSTSVSRQTPASTTLAPRALPALARPPVDAIEQAIERAQDELNANTQAIRGIVPALGRLQGGGTLNVLVLFQNTTELRPSGGFWGSFALAKLNQQGRDLTVENTYTLDANADRMRIALPRPPEPIQRYLKVNRWYFRDRNWSPDFPTTAREAIAAYRALGGQSSIDVVAALNTTVLERLLMLTGELPLAHGSVTSATVVDTLEQLVEIDYPRLGYTTFTRKDILNELLTAITEALARQSITQLLEVPIALKELLDNREIQLYSADPMLQEYITEHRWDGGLPEANGDGLMVVEANMASLKTNRLVDRTIDYTINQVGDTFEASAALTLINLGHIDWRTTRYRTYVRFYVPYGSRVLGVEGSLEDERRLNPNARPSPVDITTEKGWTVFGVFTSVEPKETRILRIRYRLPPSIIRAGQGVSRYTLTLAKQSGVKPIPLTLSGQFATTIVRSSSPLEHRGSHWTWRGSLRTPQQLWIDLTP